MLGGAATSMLQDFSSLLGVKSNVNNELAVIQSRDLVEAVVQSMDLHIKYYKLGVIGKAELYSETPFKVKFINLSDSLTTSILFSIKVKNQNTLQISSNDFDTAFVKDYNFTDTLNSEIGRFYITKTNTPFDPSLNYGFTVSSPDQVVDDFINKKISVDITDKLATYMDIELTANDAKKRRRHFKNTYSKLYKKKPG